MRQFLLILGASFMLLTTNCDKKTSSGEPVCDGNCIFSLTEASGTIIKMDCFNRFAIRAKHPETDSTIYGIPDNMDSRFEQEGKTVIFSGVFRQNELSPTFPDPSFPPQSIFQVGITDIR